MGTENANETIHALECSEEISKSGAATTPMYCPFNLESGSYAWINESLQDPQHAESLSTSQFSMKMLDATCKRVIGLRQDLMPGRYCTDGYQCKSGLCNNREYTCVGNEKDSNCYQDTDCDTGMYCRMSENWPYQTTCSMQRSEYELCTNDFDCQNNQFCWFPNKEHKQIGRRTCMPVYSQEDGVLFGWESKDINNPTQEDFKQNGQYCQSGLAYPAGPDEARCTSFKEMK